MVELVEVDLLGGAVRHGPDEPGLGRERRLHAVVLRQAEVHQPGLEVGRAIGTSRRAHQDVRRLDVAVDDAVAMDVVERMGQLQQRVEHFGESCGRPGW